MVWILERGDERIQLETRYTDDAEFVLISHSIDGQQQIERFPNAMTFQERVETLEEQLEADRWKRAGTVLLQDGWKIG